MQKIKESISKSLVSSISLPKAILYIIKNAWTWWLIITPIIINLILTVLFGKWIYIYFTNLIKNSFDSLSKIAFLNSVIHVVIFIVVIILSLLALIIISQIVSGPFNGLIAEKILIKHGKYTEPPTNSFKLIFREIKRAIEFEIGKLFLSIIILIITSIINLIPIVGTAIYLGINYIFTGYINTMDFYDPALSLLEYNFKDKRAYVWSTRYVNLIPMLITAFLINIPLINSAYIPIATVAATLELVD